MQYYEVALSGLNLKPLTYESEFDIEIFSAVSVKVKNKICKGFVIKSVEKPKFKTSAILEILPQKLTQIQIKLAEFISRYYTCEISVCLGLFEPYYEISSINYSFIKSPKLSQKQQNALEFIKQNSVSLLFGDTGSGKSEVYISIIKEVLNKNKQALLLMPEISLTPQMQMRLESYFGSSVGIWHSKITPKNKKMLLERFFRGEIKLIAGARSALFLPFWNLGLIVVDEEHDDSYKNSSEPYYNARDLSVYLASFGDIKVVLGSATPSVSSFFKFKHFRLKGTFFDSKKEFIYDNFSTALSHLIIENIDKTLKMEKQAVIFLPTRANFKFLTCINCFSSIKCPFCSVSMSLHKKTGSLKCHYCGFSTAIPNSCPKCGSDMLEANKIGTSELVLSLEKAFPNARIAKFDKDEITTQNKLTTLLKNFNNKKIDILVGTQMLSKGHDYHNVDLAVIMGLDEHLEYADFRAREKTLALAMQVAGRAARVGEGRVIIQTNKSEFFQEYLEDYDKFLEDELEARNPLYPPFARLLRIVIEDKNEQNALKFEKDILSNLKDISNLEIIGHGKALIEFISLKHRRSILLRSDSHIPLLKAAKIARYYGAHADIDPVNFN
ncbi:primosomal protein N' [Campylobacter fetus]|uniref:primosomal protein N' n=1 Tax=Campylobacter fetus TaxID=196 RepID=UPI000FCBDF61|nr:primosomal protein N' [Campylobacter fetus]RUT51239.1 primosomal protein N' [Campylobacter fetus]RUT51966.1 primosomal protein N' [Campylobacter fetus]